MIQEANLIVDTISKKNNDTLKGMKTSIFVKLMKKPRIELPDLAWLLVTELGPVSTADWTQKISYTVSLGAQRAW